MVDALRQFRDRYPQGKITSELLTIQDSQFIVRVTIQATDAGIATGIAADTRVEAAEDRARQRALQSLGFENRADAGSLLPPLSPPSNSALATSQKLSKPSISESTPADSDESAPPAQEKISAKPAPQPAAPPEPSPAIEAPKKTPLPNAAPLSGTENLSSSQTSDFTSLETPLPAPVNLSDVIAQTDVELRRLGWSVIDGREHLEKTYGKRSRHDLTDEELLSFLLHLEALPTPP